MTELWQLGAVEAAAMIRRGETTSEAVIRATLERIAERDGAVDAWEWLDPEAARTEARARDAGPATGPLHGVPVAVKDLIDTADMPSGYGSAIYAGQRPSRDAACVETLRRAGAVILGKTVTTEFATFRPGKTRNPHDPARTPGGSSSGSAAAVAAGMAPLALGTQTVGSVIRPASFCGVVGFKASHGALDVTGIKPLATALDSLGCFARSAGDAALWFSALSGKAAAAARTRPPRVALVRTAQWDEADQASRDAVLDAAGRLADAGAAVEEPALPDAFARLAAAQDVVFAAGAVEALAREWREHADALSPQLIAVLERGRAIGEAERAAAGAVAASCRDELSRLFGRFDLILSPAAKGEAPEGLGSTGDPLFNRMWTLMLGPCATLPTARGAARMPVGVQLVGALGQDAAFLASLVWAAEALGLGKGVAPV